MPRLTNKGVPLTNSQLQAIRDDLGVTALLDEKVSFDEDGNIPVQGVQFARAGAVSLEEDVTSYNTLGNLVRHDGVSDGDDLPYLEPGWRITKYQEITAGQNQAGVSVELGRFTIPASLATENRHFIVKGSISAEHGAGTNVPGYIIGFIPEGVAPSPSTQSGIGYVNNLTAKASQCFPAFYLDMFLSGAGVYALTPSAYPIGILLSGDSGAACDINLSQLAWAGDFSEVGPVGATHDMILYYMTVATASAPATKLTIDLTIFPVL